MLKWVICTGSVIVINLFFRSFNIFSEKIINLLLKHNNELLYISTMIYVYTRSLFENYL